MPKHLSDSEIKQRLVRLSNLERLHAHDRRQITELKAENKHLKAQLTEVVTRFEAIVEAQAARIEELESMVFGQKPQGGSPAGIEQKKKETAIARPASSYRRPIPPMNAITAKEHHSTSACHRCGHTLTKKEVADRYEEDIVLAALSTDPALSHKTVTKQTIERGWCGNCRQWSSARDLRGQVVTIGPVVRSLIVYLVVQADQTYAQTQDLLWQLYRFPVTEGEITNILHSRRLAYLPHYERLKESIRAGPAHLDETRYRIQSEQGAGYAHVMAGADGTKAEYDVVFRLADSRGKGNSEALVGDSYQSVGITDRYGAYKHLFLADCHQICWAHLQRTARDLTRLECLDDTKLTHVTAFYAQLAATYADIRTYQAEPYDKLLRSAQAASLLEHIKALCQPHDLDPKKLTDLKAGILEYQDCLFLCLTTDGIPADNNKAERLLRKLVIKRKKSLSVKTSKGARTLEVLLSVCQSLYNRDKDTILPRLHALATALQ